MPYEWTTELSVHDATLDDHHKKFIEELKAIDENPVDENDKDRIAGIFDFLDEHIFRHFKYEEDYMYNHGFPDLPEHKKLHEAFVTAYEKFKADIQDPESKRTFLDLHQYLKQWLVDHIQDKDKCYDKYIQQNPDSHPDNEDPEYHTVVHF